MDEVPRPTNGGSRPIPDPTVLTDKAIERSDKAMRDWVGGQLAIRDQRMDGIDEATELRMGTMEAMPHLVDEKVANLQRLVDEKFAGIVTQFKERDMRSERESRDNKGAVDAAFAAQKEAAAKQDEANAKAIDKSERATSETIKTNLDLTRADTGALAAGLAEVKERVTRIEAAKLGAKEDRTGLYAAVAIVAVVLSGLLGIAGLILALGSP